MTGTPLAVMTAKQRRRLVIRGGLRTLATVAVLLILYYVLPLDRAGIAAITELVAGLLALGVVLVVQIRAIGKHEHPGVRAVEALAFTIPFFLILFATTYFLMARAQPTNFTEPLTRTDALYFTVTVFSTVGFGDITAKSEATRLIVTVQMLLDLVVVGVVVQTMLSAVKRGQQRLASPAQEQQAPR